MLDANFTLWIVFLLIDLSFALIAFRLFGKQGLYLMIIMNIILANIQVIKTVEMLGFVATLGNILYGSIFFATDILSECYGKKSAKKGVWMGFFAIIVTTIVMYLTLFFVPHESDFIHPHLEAIFSFLPRIVFASLVAYIISQNHDIWLFHLIKKKTKGRYLWFRNTFSTMTSQLIDSIIFTIIAFYGVFSFDIWFQILITTYVFKLLVAVLDTPFIYIAKYWIASEKKLENEEKA